MSVLRAADKLGMSSTGGTVVGDSPLLLRARDCAHPPPNGGATERMRDLVKAVKSGTDQEMIRVKIIELLDGRTTYGRGHYDFHQLPLTADKIVVHNRRGLYDIMRVLSTAPAPETTIYVKWIAERADLPTW